MFFQDAPVLIFVASVLDERVLVSGSADGLKIASGVEVKRPTS